MEPDGGLLERTGRTLERLKARKLKLVSAESCTGGLAAAAITDVPGSSEVYDLGVVTYSNEAKQALLGVPAELLAAHGAVSEPVARAMAAGALEGLGGEVAFAVTGIAGPGGGSPEKPVGLVHFAAALRGGPVLHKQVRFGDIGRAEIRRRSVAEALRLVDELLEQT